MRDSGRFLKKIGFVINLKSWFAFTPILKIKVKQEYQDVLLCKGAGEEWNDESEDFIIKLKVKSLFPAGFSL